LASDIRRWKESVRATLRNRSTLHAPDTGSRPLAFGVLALLTGAMTGLVPLAVVDPALLPLIVALGLPFLAIAGIALFRYWRRSGEPLLYAVEAGGESVMLSPDDPTHRVAAQTAAPPATVPSEKHRNTLLETGLLVLVFTTYTRFSDVLVHEHGLPSFAQPLVALLLLGIAFSAFLRQREYRGWQLPALLLAVYAVVRAGSLLYAANFGLAFEAVIDYAKDAIIALVVVLLLFRGVTLRRVTWSLLLAGIFLGTISTVQFLTGDFYRDFLGFGEAQIMHIIDVTEDFRLGGPLGEPNAYAQFMLPLIALALERVVHERRLWLRLLAAWAFVAVLLAVVFTYSRGALVSVVAMLGLLLILRPPKARHIMAGVVVALLLLPFIPGQYLDRMATLLEFLPGMERQPTQEVSFRGRTSEWTVGWLMFVDHPIVGVGLHNYPLYYQEYSRELGIDPRREPRAPHSLYLEIMAELGLLGVASFGAILWAVFHGMHVARARLAYGGREDLANLVLGLTIGLFGYLCAAVFLHGAYPRFLWLLAGIALAVPRVALYETKQASPQSVPFPATPGALRVRPMG
jgi:O-antigen ligase